MIIKEINEPKEWEKQGDWGSHLPLLYLSLKNTKGIVVELGSGLISTPLIKNESKTNDRLFYSFDSKKEWCKKTNSFFIDNWEKTDEWVIGCGLVFVDEAPAEHRKLSILKYANIADVIVVHDTEIGAEYVYGMAESLSSFKYRIDYEPIGVYPRTTAVSNFIDITKWVNQ